MLFEPLLWVGLLIGLNLFWAALLWRYIRRSAALEQTLHELRQKPPMQYDGIARATLKGQIAEQIAPMLPGFPFHPADFRFIGHPIDFLVFAGLTHAKEGLGDIHEIVIGDIKLGNARLSRHQQMIKRAVEEGRVRWETIHIGQDFRVLPKGREQ